VKSTTEVSARHFKNLQLFAEEQAVEQYILVSRDEVPQKRNAIRAMHWKEFLNELWGNKIILVNRFDIM